MENETPTGLKQMFQTMMPDGAGVVEGTVTCAAPLQITLTNDSKMVLGENSLIVPRELTDHQVEVDLELASGALDSVTKVGGSHKHEDEGEHEGHTSGTGKHTHIGGTHSHALSTFSLTTGVLKLYNGLKKGETVLLLSFNNGKQYYVLDRKG